MKTSTTIQYEAGDIVDLLIRANPAALAELVLRDLAAQGYDVSPNQLSLGPGGSVIVNGPLPPARPAAPPSLTFAPPAAPQPVHQPWAQRPTPDAERTPAYADPYAAAPAPSAAPLGWHPPAPQHAAPQPQPQPLYVAEPLAPPAPRLQAPPQAAPPAPAPLASRVFGAPHAAEVANGLPVVPGEEVLGHTPTGTLFTRLGTRPSLAGAEEGGPGDGYPDLSAMQSDAPTITSRPGDGSDPRFNAVDIPGLEQPRQPRVREVGRSSGLADKVQREGVFSDGAPPPRLTGTGGFAWNPQGPGQGDPGPRPSFLDAFVNNPNKE